jgi:uncharacterized protein YndB with AHSA1/START domain
MITTAKRVSSGKGGQMPDIVHEFLVNASPAWVFEMLSTADGLNRWCTKEANGEPKV